MQIQNLCNTNAADVFQEKQVPNYVIDTFLIKICIKWRAEGITSLISIIDMFAQFFLFFELRNNFKYKIGKRYVMSLQHY